MVATDCDKAYLQIHTHSPTTMNSTKVLNQWHTCAQILESAHTYYWNTMEVYLRFWGKRRNTERSRKLTALHLNFNFCFYHFWKYCQKGLVNLFIKAMLIGRWWISFEHLIQIVNMLHLLLGWCFGESAQAVTLTSIRIVFSTYIPFNTLHSQKFVVMSMWQN